MHSKQKSLVLGADGDVLETPAAAIDGIHQAMKRIKHLLVCAVRFILITATPRFGFSLASRGFPRNGTASAIPVSDGRETDVPSSQPVAQRKRLEVDTAMPKERGGWQSTVTYRGTVYPWQCDHMGHMNVMWYVGKFDEASWQLLSKLGFTRSRFARDGIGMAAVEQHIDYKRELYAGDLVTIRSAVMEVKEKSIRVLHEMSNDETGELAATTVIVGIHIDASLRKARPLPSEIRERAVLQDPGRIAEFMVK
jgi:acyl-CoA thioester hydrolase